MKNTNYRKERVAQYLSEYTRELLQQEDLHAAGLSASDIAQVLSLDRTCVSRDLNALYRDGLALKLLGKPTLYLYYDTVAEHLDNQRIPNTIPIGGSLSDYVSSQNDAGVVQPEPGTGPSRLYDRNAPSLYRAALQAEAAINYPGYGLHTLISGQHGIGKRTFLEKMFAYGKEIGKFAPNAKLYSFDCQSAINSSPSSLQQALTIQFFGCGAGLFSPNSPSRKGLVEQATDSILLIDNPQLLPASIQEKLINLIMYNAYSRLGEGTVARQARLMVVAICSELPLPVQQCPLLQHFPVHIHLPSLSERTPSEAFFCIVQFFEAEAKALRCDLHVSTEVFYALMCTSSSSEFISLRGYIKSICAMAYREQKTASPYYFLDIKHHHLPQSVLACRPDPSAVAQYTSFLNQHFGGEVLIRQDGSSALPSTLFSAETSFQATAAAPFPDAELHPIEYYLKRYLYAAFESNGTLQKELTDPTSHAWQVLRRDPVLGKLSPEDPLIQGLISLFPTTAISHTPLHPSLQQEAVFLQPPSLAVDTIKELEHQLRPFLAEDFSSYQRSFAACYLHLIQHWAAAEKPLMFIAFHGEGVSAGLAHYLERLFPCRLIPLSFSPADTLETIFAQIDQALSSAPPATQALFFSDGLPLDSLHSYVESTYGFPAKTLCRATFESIYQTVAKITKFHFALDMVNTYVPASKSENVLAAPAQLSPFVLEAIQQFLVPSLSFIDINSSLPLVEDSLKAISTQLQLSISDEVAIKYHFHCAHMLERVIRKEPFDYPQLKTFVNQHARLIRVISGALKPLAQHYGLRIPTCEVAYLSEIFLPM